jgi:hypothetical protein
MTLLGICGHRIKRQPLDSGQYLFKAKVQWYIHSQFTYVQANDGE